MHKLCLIQFLATSITFSCSIYNIKNFAWEDQSQKQCYIFHIRYRSIITSFLHAWTRVAPREIFKYSRSVFAWTTISRGVEHTRLVYHHAWLLHARLLHAWLLHTWLAITRVAGYYTRRLFLQAKAF